MIKFKSKSEWFELESPVGEPNYDWKRYHGNSKYPIERRINEDGSIVWFGIETNWKKEKDGEWGVLTTNENAKPLEHRLPEIVYGGDRTYFAPCQIPIYEALYNQFIIGK